jgi:hypothetical protein
MALLGDMKMCDQVQMNGQKATTPLDQEEQIIVLG